jgi:hypothetical protein
MSAARSHGILESIAMGTCVGSGPRWCTTPATNRRTVPRQEPTVVTLTGGQTWRDDFEKLLLQQTPTSFRQAIALKDKNAPDALFKFFRPNDYAFGNLAEQTVFLASPEQFNDPYDSGLAMDAVPTLLTLVRREAGPDFDDLRKIGLTVDDFADLLVGKLSQRALEILKRAQPETSPEDIEKFAALFPKVVQMLNQKYVDEQLQPFFQKGLKIACFSERADSLVLWAHYAAQHEGFCLEYGYRDMPLDAVQRRLLFPVLYKQERFDIGPSLHEVMRGKEDFMPTHAIVAALHKAVDWAYEREWRLVNPDGREAGFIVPMVKPRAVHAGLRMTEGNRRRLREVCTAIGVPLLTPTLSPSKYELVIERAGTERVRLPQQCPT